MKKIYFLPPFRNILTCRPVNIEKSSMTKATKLILFLLLTGMVVFGGCSILKKNSCGCPPIPKAGKMRH